jgi:hypothetical protein
MLTKGIQFTKKDNLKKTEYCSLIQKRIKFNSTCFLPLFSLFMMPLLGTMYLISFYLKDKLYEVNKELR